MKSTGNTIVNAPTPELEWARDGTLYSSRSRADKMPRLPSGVYQYTSSLMGWYLNRISDRFEFPFKVYSACDKTIARIVAYWQNNTTNLGVLMNGLRGAGKTMAAQLLANRLIEEENLPVLVIRDPIPLDTVLEAAARENMMVIFDEFEKTHSSKNEDGVDHQQKLLTTIDGMSRTTAKRLFLFTTNTTEIDENFKDRPSRIRYQFEFSRVADEVIEGLIGDGLPLDLHYLKPDILAYLDTRTICTIDIVKAVISEVRTFREPPSAFEEILNITKGEPPAYVVSILDPADNSVQKVWKEYFKINEHHAGVFAGLLNGSRTAIEKFAKAGRPVDIPNSYGEFAIRLLEWCSSSGGAVTWLANLAVPKSYTVYGKFTWLYGDVERFYYDTAPAGWSFPYTPAAIEDDHVKRQEVDTLFRAACESQNIHGTPGVENRVVFKIRIEPSREKASGYKPTGYPI